MLRSLFKWLFILSMILIFTIGILIKFNVITHKTRKYFTIVFPNDADVYDVESRIMRVKNLDKSLEDLVVVQISDIHRTVTNGKLVRNIVKEVNKLKPDLIFVTGDMIHGNREECGWVINDLSKLESKYGTYVSWGNHDIWHPINKVLITKAIKNTNLKLLENEKDVLFDGKLEIVGLGDLWSKHNKDQTRAGFKPDLVLKNADSDVPRLVLSHNPDTATLLKKYHDLVIFSGHTHGSQIRLPLFGPVYPIYCLVVNILFKTIPGKFLRKLPVGYTNILSNHEWVEGLFNVPGHKQGTSNTLFVSRGIGTHNGTFRWRCNPQIAKFTLKSL